MKERQAQICLTALLLLVHLGGAGNFNISDTISMQPLTSRFAHNTLWSYMNAPKQIHVTTSPLCPREFLLWQKKKNATDHTHLFFLSRDAVEYVRNMKNGKTCVEAGYLDIQSRSQCTTAFKLLNHDAKKSKKYEVSSHLLRLFLFIYLCIYFIIYLCIYFIIYLI